MGWKNISIGDYSQIGHDTIIQANSENPAISKCNIGKHCLLGARNFVNIGQAISFGDYLLTAPNCSFICGEHISDATIPYVRSGVDCTGSIIIGVNCFIGAGAIVLKNVSVGHGSIIGAGSVVTKSMPPFSLAVGNPAKVIRRYRFAENTWVNSGEFTEEDESLLPSEATYLESIRSDKGRLPTTVATTFLADW